MTRSNHIYAAQNIWNESQSRNDKEWMFMVFIRYAIQRMGNHLVEIAHIVAAL